jgi:hypothetical protein
MGVDLLASRFGRGINDCHCHALGFLRISRTSRSFQARHSRGCLSWFNLGRWCGGPRFCTRAEALEKRRVLRISLESAQGSIGRFRLGRSLSGLDFVRNRAGFVGQSVVSNCADPTSRLTVSGFRRSQPSLRIRNRRKLQSSPAAPELPASRREKDFMALDPGGERGRQARRC